MSRYESVFVFLSQIMMGDETASCVQCVEMITYESQRLVHHQQYLPSFDTTACLGPFPARTST